MNWLSNLLAYNARTPILLNTNKNFKMDRWMKRPQNTAPPQSQCHPRPKTKAWATAATEPRLRRQSPRSPATITRLCAPPRKDGAQERKKARLPVICLRLGIIIMTAASCRLLLLAAQLLRLLVPNTNSKKSIPKADVLIVRMFWKSFRQSSQG